MRALHAGCLSMLALCAGAATAQETPIAAGDVLPGKDQTGVVHVNAMKNPEIHSYRAIVAGLDKFDELHALAPAVPRLLFAARARNGGPLRGPVPAATLSADDFALALPVDADAQFEVPRSRQAWDARAELVLSRRRSEVRVWPAIRTPGLADNQRRLGDLRLECQVLVAVGKEEAPFWAVALGTSVMLTGDWCSILKNKDRTWHVHMPAELASATLRDGERSVALKVKGNAFAVPISDTGWSNDALVEVTYAPAEPAADPAPATRTADETPRTAP